MRNVWIWILTVNTQLIASWPHLHSTRLLSTSTCKLRSLRLFICISCSCLVWLRGLVRIGLHYISSLHNWTDPPRCKLHIASNYIHLLVLLACLVTAACIPSVLFFTFNLHSVRSASWIPFSNSNVLCKFVHCNLAFCTSALHISSFTYITWGSTE